MGRRFWAYAFMGAGAAGVLVACACERAIHGVPLLILGVLLLCIGIEVALGDRG